MRLHAIFQRSWFELLVAGLILISVGLLVAEIAGGVSHPHYREVETAGDVLTWVFVVELTLRGWAAPRRRKFLRAYWLDILAVVPVMRALRVLRVLRLLRLFRVGVVLHRRLGSLSHTVASAISLQLGLFITIGVFVLAGALAIHVVEGKQNPAFATLDGSIWWGIFTLVAGEPIGGSPQSTWGKVITSLVALGGMMSFAVLTGIVSAVMVQRLKKGLDMREWELSDLRGHIVMCGWNRAAPLLMEELQAASDLKDTQIVVICERPALPDDELRNVDRSRLYFHQGDYTRIDVLKDAGIEHASRALLLADSSLPRTDQDRDARTVLAALLIEKLNSEIYTCAQLLDRRNDVQLHAAGVEDVIIEDQVNGTIIATAVRNRGIAGFFDELLSVQVGNQLYKVAIPEAWSQSTFSEAAQRIKSGHDATAVAIVRGEQTWVNPELGFTLAVQDEVIVIGRQRPALS